MKLANIKLLAAMTALTLGGSWAAPVFAQNADAGVSGTAAERVTIHADSANDIQAALDALPAEGGEVVVAAGEFELSAPINMRGRGHVTIRGAGRQATGNNPGTLIHANFGSADQPVFEMVAAHHCELADFSIRQTERLGHDPACAVLLGQDAQAFAGLNTFSELRIYGRFEVASVINLGSEANTWSRCSFMNLSGQPSYWSSSWNTMGIESPFGDLRGGSVMGGLGAVSNTTQRFVDCAFGIPEDRNNPRRFEDAYAIRIEPRQLGLRFDRCAFVGPEFSRAAILVVGDENSDPSVSGLWLNQVKARDYLGQSVIECTGQAVFSQIVIEGQGVDGERGQVTLTGGASLGQPTYASELTDFVESLQHHWDSGVALQLALAVSPATPQSGIISGIATGAGASDSAEPLMDEVVQASLTDTEQDTNIEIVDIDPAAGNDTDSAQAAASDEAMSDDREQAQADTAPSPSVGVIGFQSASSQDDEEAQAVQSDNRVADAMPDVSFRDTPGQYVLGTNTPLRLNVSGAMPEGGDMLALAWSFDESKLADDFAHLVDPANPQISADRLNRLPAGSYEIQVLVRRDNTTVDRQTLALTVSEPVVEDETLPLPTASFVDAPATYELGSGQAVEIGLTGELPQGSDVLVLAWSVAEERMVGEFAFVLDENNRVIPSQQLDLLPVGSVNLQLLVRSDNVTKMRVTTDLEVTAPPVNEPMAVAFAGSAASEITLGQAQAIAFAVIGDDAGQCDLLIQARPQAVQGWVAGFTHQAPASNGSIAASRLETLAEGAYVLQITLRHNGQAVQQVSHALTVSAPVVVPDPQPPVDTVEPSASFAPGIANSFEDGDNTSLAFAVVGDDLRDHDIVIQAWSATKQRLVSDFAYATQAASGSIPASRLALLPAGDNYIQVILRKNFEVVEIAEHRISVAGDTTQQGSPDDEEDDVPVIDVDDPDSEDDEDGDTGNGGGSTDDNGDNNTDNTDDSDHTGSGGGDASSGGADHNWPTGAAGFTALPVASGGRVIYVSTSGSDSRDGLTPQTAVRTPQQGYRLLRNGRPDQLRFRAGDVFERRIYDWTKSGRSADAPMVIGVYGEGARPRFEIDGALFYVEGNRTVRYLAVQGLHLHCTKRDPRHEDYRSNAYPAQGIFWVGAGSDLLIEDCIIEFFAYGMTIDSPAHDDLIERVTIRRNIIRYCWNTGHGNRAGMITGFVKDLVIEENFYDHNGWLPPAWGVSGATPDDQSHAVYLAPLPEEEGPDVPAIVRGNIFARSGSHGIKGGPGGVLEDNLFVGNAIAGYMSRSDSVIRGNIVLEGRDISSNSIRGWGLEAFGMRNLTVENNIFAHRRSDGIHGHALKMHASNITYRGNMYYDWARTDQPNLDYIGGNSAMVSSGNFGNAFTMHDGGSFVDPGRSVGSYHGSLGKEATLEAFLATAGARPRSTWDPAYAQAGVDAYIRDGFQVVPFD